MNHRDGIGKLVEIGDICVRVSAHNCSAEPHIVVGMTESFIKLNDERCVHSDCVIVINDQLYANGNDIWTKRLESKYREQIAKGRARLNHH